jgi:hypothetical protein
MADKTVKVKVDVETDVEPSLAALRTLKKQLRETAAGSKEFIALQQQIDDVQDSLVAARLSAGNFTDVLGGLPGPIGAIGGQLSGTLGTLKQFSAVQFTNIQASFVDLGNDITDIAKGFFNLTGITKVYTVLNTALAKSFVAVGIGETAAAAGAKAFAAALTATGIGALVVALGLLIANWEKVKDAITGATKESKTYDEAQSKVTEGLTDFNKKLIEVENSFQQAKDGTISKDSALKLYNETLGKTVGFAGSLDEAEELLAANTAVVVEGIKLRTQANVFYAKSAEAAAKAVSGEDVDPTVWQSVGNFILSGGQALIFSNNQVKTYAKNLKDVQDNVKIFEKEGDILTQKALENDKKLKKGLETPPNFEAAAKAAEEAAKKREADAEKRRQDALTKAKAADAVELEAFKATLQERERLELEAGLKLAERKKVLEEAGRTDFTSIEEQYRITLAEIKKKYDDAEAKTKEEKDAKDKEALLKKQEEERGILLTGLQERLEALDRENKLAEFDFEQDLVRLAEQRAILAEQESIDLQNEELTEFQKTEIRKKYADARRAITDEEINTERAAMMAKQEINLAYLGLFEQFGSLLGQIAGKNKALAISGIIIQQAAAIGQIIANTAIANAKAVAALPLVGGMPFVAINTISAGLSIASTIAAAAKSVQQINSQPGAPASNAGAAGGGGAQISAPRVGGMAAPQVQTGGGMNPTQQIGETLGASQKPVRAYVVSGDVSSQQALDRRTSRAATFTGG